MKWTTYESELVNNLTFGKYCSPKFSSKHIINIVFLFKETFIITLWSLQPKKIKIKI